LERNKEIQKNLLHEYNSIWSELDIDSFDEILAKEIELLKRTKIFGVEDEEAARLNMANEYAKVIHNKTFLNDFKQVRLDLSNIDDVSFQKSIVQYIEKSLSSILKGEIEKSKTNPLGVVFFKHAYPYYMYCWGYGKGASTFEINKVSKHIKYDYNTLLFSQFFEEGFKIGLERNLHFEENEDFEIEMENIGIFIY